MKLALIAGLSFVMIGVLLQFFLASTPVAVALSLGLILGGTLGILHTLRR